MMPYSILALVFLPKKNNQMLEVHCEYSIAFELITLTRQLHAVETFAQSLSVCLQNRQQSSFAKWLIL